MYLQEAVLCPNSSKSGIVVLFVGAVSRPNDTWDVKTCFNGQGMDSNLVVARPNTVPVGNVEGGSSKELRKSYD